MPSRIEATIPTLRLFQLRELERETGLGRSKIVDAALELWVRAAEEAKRGRKVWFMGGGNNVEWSSPALEWAASYKPKVPGRAAKRVPKRNGN